MKINIKNKKNILFFIVIAVAIFLFSLKVYEYGESKAEGTWIIEIVDNETGEKISGAEVIVTGLNKKYIIDYSNNIVSLPQKPFYKHIKKGKYEYGYTIVTHAEGYLPRIDHNLTMGKGSAANILIELEKPEPFSNASYVEVFHNSPGTGMADFLGYYIK